MTGPIRHRSGCPHAPRRQRRGYPCFRGAFRRPEAAPQRRRSPLRSWARCRRHGEAALGARIGFASAQSRGCGEGPLLGNGGKPRPGPLPRDFRDGGDLGPSLRDGRDWGALGRGEVPLPGGPGPGLEDPGLGWLLQVPPSAAGGRPVKAPRPPMLRGSRGGAPRALPDTSRRLARVPCRSTAPFPSLCPGHWELCGSRV